MLGDIIQTQVWKGYGIAAGVLGSIVTQYRPTSAVNPMAPGNIVSLTLPAVFDATPYKFNKPNLYGQPVWYALIDATGVRAGDYLVNATDTYFVAALQHLLPIACVQTNRVLNVLRPASPGGFGPVGYQGDDKANEVVIMTGWPGSMITKSRGERNDVGLPGDVKVAVYEFLLPAIAGVDILYTDVITDNHGRRYKISSVELSDLGWRILAMLAMA